MQQMFNFPKADRSEIKYFKRNYLKSVIFQIKFPSTDLIIEKKQEILSFFKDSFPRVQESPLPSFELSLKADLTPILQPISDKKLGYQTKSQDGRRTTTATDHIHHWVISRPASLP